MVGAACGGGSESSAPTTITTTDSSTATTGSTGGGGTTGGKPPIKVNYPGGGPVDNMLPLNEDAYGLLEKRECARLRSRAEAWAKNESVRDNQGSAVDLYHGAAAACLSMWSTAKDDLARVKSSDVNSCDRRTALAFLQAMVAAHDSDPSVAPDISGTGSGCTDGEPDPPDTTEPPDSTTPTTRSSTTTTAS